MLVASFVIALIIEIGLPFGLAIWSIKRHGLTWRIIGIGAVAIMAAQIANSIVINYLSGLITGGSLPAFNNSTYVLYNVLVAGVVSIGLQGLARWASFKMVKGEESKPATAWGLAVGHGGMEILLTGAQILFNLITIFSITSNGVESLGLSAEETAAMSEQIAQFWAFPIYIPLLDALQCCVFFAFQFLASTMMGLSFALNKKIWIASSILVQLALFCLITTLSLLDIPIWFYAILLVGFLSGAVWGVRQLRKLYPQQAA